MMKSMIVVLTLVLPAAGAWYTGAVLPPSRRAI